ncbi:MAG: hypothetical protein IH830_02080 [Planctomycetes bacterium]|nr:hypothetical protein [Planctomycetota bacterium]
MKGKLAGYIGMTIGFLGWIIGLAVVCVLSGQTSLLARVVPTGVLISLGLALTAIVMMECALRVFRGGGFFQLTLWGVLGVDVGILWLLINHWLAPMIAAEPRLVETMQHLGGVYKTTDAFPLALLAVGVVLLAIATVRMLRSPRSGGESPPAGRGPVQGQGSSTQGVSQ